jgi:O-antigen/teichoic acid export membrane protein
MKEMVCSPRNRSLSETASGGLFGFLGQVTGRVLALILSIVLARGLGAAQYGVFALVQIVIDLARTCALLGLPSGLLRYLPHYDGQANTVGSLRALHVALGVGLSASLVGTLGLLWLAPSLAPQLAVEPILGTLLQVSALALPFVVFLTLVSFICLARHQVKQYLSLQHLLLPGATLVFTMFALFLQGDLLSVAWASVAAAVLTAVVSYRWLTPACKPRQFFSGNALSELKILLPFSLTVLLASLTSLVLTQADRFILTVFVPLTQLGIYHAAAKTAMQLTLIRQGFSLVVSPTISRLYSQRSINELATLYKTVSRWILTLSLPAAALLILYAREIMSIFGLEFVEGSWMLGILTIAYLVMNGVGPTGHMLQMIGRPKLSLLNGILTVILSLALNLWLVQHLGAWGVALGTGIGLALINLLEMLEIHWILKMHPFCRSYGKTWWAGFISFSIGGLTMMITRSLGEGVLLLLPGLALTLSFGLALWLLGLDQADRALLQEVRMLFRTRSFVPKSVPERVTND